MENLDIQTYFTGNMDETLAETLQEIMDKYDNQPSIKKLKESVIEVNGFSFSDMILQDLENQILKLDTKKAIIEADIPTKILIALDERKYAGAILTYPKLLTV